MPTATRHALSSLALFVLAITTTAAAAADRPNIVYILADDMGYGDVSCLNPKSRIRTPHIDRLAAAGMAFTDAHTASAVCTPTRYGILTGRYPWRTRLKSNTLDGYSPHLIEPGRLTVASMLKQHGYHTACFGKWHLGMDWEGAGGSDAGGVEKRIDYARPIANGPTSVGFDQFFGISASLDMPPFIWIKDDRTVGVPTTRKKWLREGPAERDFEAVDVLPTLTDKAVEYVSARAKAGGPFFLYLPLAAPHTPVVPSKDFAGKSGVSPYADFVMQVDATVGRVLDALDANGLAKDTLVIFTTDNGFAPLADLKAHLDQGHHPSHVFRGTKADLFEGGHRVPFVARWPGKVKAGATGADVICLNDLMATAADILGIRLPDNAGEDSASILPALLGTARGPVREATVHASINGALAVRQGKWKLLLAPGSGGWSSPRTPKELRGLPAVQLYDLEADIGERTNVHAQHPEVVARLTALLQSYIDTGRSTPGAPQKNDTPTSLYMGGNKKPTP